MERIEQVDLVGIRDKSIVKVLFLDWHQVVDRGRDGKTDTLGKVPTSGPSVILLGKPIRTTFSCLSEFSVISILIGPETEPSITSEQLLVFLH